jgi:putative N6-adenine-specific DNA methylase
MTIPEVWRYYVSCPPGLEPMLAKEYHTLGMTRLKIPVEQDHDEKPTTGDDTGGMEFEGPLEHVYLANLHMRTASRVIIRLAEFKVITFAELRKKASKLPWELFLQPGIGINIHATCRKSRLYHSDAVAERVLAAITDHFTGLKKTVPLLGNAETTQTIHVRLNHDECTLSVDSSGDLLHRRGYRQAVTKAPLRENIAAGMLLTTGWDMKAPLIDPFCGSGTIPIEAALLAQNIPPGITRKFQFMEWPMFNDKKWLEILDQAKKNIQPSHLDVFGYDRDTGAVEMAAANASRAGQKDTIQFARQAISDLVPTGTPGWIVTNPPYGIRIQENKDLRDLYARFGSILKSSFKAWKVCLLSNDDRLIANLNLGEPHKKIALTNGGIPVNLVFFDLK